MRGLPLLLLFLTGCSTAPVADFMDHFFPAKISNETTPGQRTRGGVCDPQPQQQQPSIGGANPVNVPLNPAVQGGPGGPPMLPTPGGMGPSELPPTDPPPGPAIRW